MKPPQAENSSRPLDADVHVVADLPCGSCGYNLRTLSLGGVCPECARPVRQSMAARFLRCADAAWVRQLARGVLLLIVGVFVFFVGRVFVLTPMPGLFPHAGPIGIPPVVLSLVGGLDQFVVLTGIMALAMLALWTLTKPDPANPTRTERVSARRLLRACTCLLPVPLVLGLLATLYSNHPIVIVGSSPRVAMASPTLTALAVGSGLTTVIALVVTPLALLQYLGALMRRVPRLGLARFCRILFWGILVSGVALLAGIAWMDFRMVISLLTVPLFSVGWNPPLPPRPPFGPGVAVAWYSAAIGWRAMIVFLSAGLVLLFLVQRALAEAAREAGRAESESVPIVSLAGSP